MRIEDKTSPHIRTKFENTWLARHPRPVSCIHDKGGEFEGNAFQKLLQRYHIKDACCTSKNPQANAICERMHQTVGNILRTTLHDSPPQNMRDAKELVDTASATAMHAMRTNVATTLDGSPGSLVFNRDMFFNVPLIADWHAITRRREHHVNENLRRQNRRRRGFDYAVGEQALIKSLSPRS